MGDEPAGRGDGEAPWGRTGRRIRADARRNIETLLHAAKTVFASSGVDAPVREIADKAEVGVGTIYRHFPQRSDLVAAVFRQEVDACADAAPKLAAEHPPGEALARWMERYAVFIAAKRGLGAALHSGNPAFVALPAYFEQRLRPALRGLLDAAAAAGESRADVEADDLLHAVARLCTPGRNGGSVQQMVAVLADGLRYGPGPSRARSSLMPGVPEAGRGGSRTP